MMGPCRTDVLALCSWHLKLFNCLSIWVVFSKGSLVSLGGLPGFFVLSPSNFKEDGNLVCILVERVSCFFIGLQINISFVDLFNAGVGKGLDLVGSFIGKPLQGVTGRIWAELKVFSARGFDNKVKFEKARLATIVTQLCGCCPVGQSRTKTVASRCSLAAFSFAFSWWSEAVPAEVAITTTLRTLISC